MPPVQCLFAAELPMKAGQVTGEHTHSCTELICYRGASGVLTQDGEAFPYRDGCLAVYQPHQAHTDATRVAGSHVCVGVVGAPAGALAPGVWTIDDGVERAVEWIREELRTPHAPREARLDALATWLTLEVLRLTGAATASPALPPAVAEAKRILDTRFHEPLSLRDLAETVFLHPDYLRQLFRQSLGEAPLHYLIRRRLEVACRLLRESEEPIRAIALHVGLENPYYFSRLFRKWIGIPPSEYRRREQASAAPPPSDPTG
ncbi:MAG: helix-turn-helix transcriptional regulator [Planctomycetota bacterium]